APVLLLVAFVFGSRIQKMSTGVQDQLADSTVVAEEGLQGIRIVKSFGREDYETQRYNAAMEKTFRASLRMALYNSSFAALMAFLGFCTITAIMWYARPPGLARRLSPRLISCFLIYAGTISPSMSGPGALFAR